MGTRKGVTRAQHQFSQIPKAEISRSQFDRSCGLKTTFDSGFLVPIFCDEALPGDTMSLKMTTFARMATPLHPIMDNLYMDFHFFAVPNRLLWTNWQKFMGEQTNPVDSTDFLTPVVPSAAAPGNPVGSLADYLGVPTDIADLESSAFWTRAYNLIWNEWFRDQNLMNSAVVDLDDGPDNLSDYFLRRRGKRHDYFTSCLPFPQKGPSVALPLGTSAPLVFTDIVDIKADGDGIPLFNLDGNVVSLDSTSGSSVVTNWSSSSGNSDSADWNSPKLKANLTELSKGVADLSAATAATINTLRQAFQIQKLYERDARGGTRYTEILLSHFGVVSPDQRLQRPEYLGGGTTTININPVAQTSASDTQPTEQGNLAAYGTAASHGIGFSKSFVEHCIIIGFASVRADLNYQQGLPRMYSRRTRWDYFWPALQHLGEQSVLNKEIYAQGPGGGTDDDDVFGYQERYAEYRYKPSMVTGQMRSTFAQTLDTWHLAQEFTSLPALNFTFMDENPPVQRIIAVPSEPEFLFDAFFSYKCARPMPVYSVPGLIDHF